MKPHRFLAEIDAADFARPHGVVRTVGRAHVEATGPCCGVGDICDIETAGAPLMAEVAAVGETRLILVPLDADRALLPGARVYRRGAQGAVAVGNAFAGRAIDALGRPIDGRGDIRSLERAPLTGALPPALARIQPHRAIATGLRAIDGLLTLGAGQRIGIFAASGVGKTSLVEQLATQIEADRCILCLVGERGREVESSWRRVAARSDAARFTLVAATSDETAPMRVRSIGYALSLAEYWRDRGEHVVLIVDSVTRLAMALREIGLAAGEPPTARAYTPNVFGALPRVVERCGALASGGAITGIMTVLSETDDVDDPIVEAMKSLLDGHIILSRTLAERGHFPAIDISRSISRLAPALASAEHAAAARAAIAMLGTYDEARMLVESGVYKAGTNGALDRAIACRSALLAVLRQRQDEHAPFAASVAALVAALPRERIDA
jgi:FliI/YscN family ATPase